MFLKISAQLCKISAHKLDPDDLEILSFLGEASLSCGDSTAAMGYAESVLGKVKNSMHWRIFFQRGENPLNWRTGFRKGKIHWRGLLNIMTFHLTGHFPFESNCRQGRIFVQHLSGVCNFIPPP